jgi:hypothetical protein
MLVRSSKFLMFEVVGCQQSHQGIAEEGPILSVVEGWAVGLMYLRG